MIRSNPTAIPLRASDVKLLQAELEKRKASTTSDVGTGQPNPSKAPTSSTAQPKQGERAEGRDAAEDRRRERQAMTAAERIGM